MLINEDHCEFCVVDSNARYYWGRIFSVGILVMSVCENGYSLDVRSAKIIRIAESRKVALYGICCKLYEICMLP
jgi:hypothetical protein